MIGKSRRNEYPYLRYNGFIRLLLISFFSVSTAFGFEMGSFINPDKNYRWHLEFFNQEKNQNVVYSSKNNNNFLNNIGMNDRTKKTRTNFLGLKSSLYINRHLSIFLEGGLYNELKPSANASFFMGGGVNVVLFNLGSFKLVPFASTRYIRSFEYEVIVTSDPDITRATVRNNFTYYSSGVLLVLEDSSKSNDKLIPHIGWEYSLFNSGKIKSFIVDTQPQVISNEKLHVQSRGHFALILGLTLLRNEFSTVQIETRYSKLQNSIALNIGFWF